MSATASAASPTVITPRGEFPGWLPPVFVKELRQGLHTRGFVGAFIIFQIVMVLMMIGSITGLPNATPAARAASMSSTNAMFWGVLAVILLAVTPGRALAGLKSEIDTRTLDLLVLTRLTAWRVVLGKWASLVSQAVLLVIAMLPYGIVRYFAGSVDLARDAITVVALLGISAVLTAASLWASGLPKIAGILIGIFVVYLQGLGGMRLFTSSTILTRFDPGVAGWWLIVLDAAVIMLYFLVAAVRRIAPPAENHAPLARLLAVLCLIPVPLAASVGRLPVARSQFFFAMAFGALVCAVELSMARRAMQVQWRAFAQRGRMGRLAAHFLLPGSAGAINYLTLFALATLAVIHTPGLFTDLEQVRVSWLVMLGFGGLLFPVAILSFRKPGGRAAAQYGLLLAALTIPGVLYIAMSGLRVRPILSDLLAVMPVTDFWIILPGLREPSDWVIWAEVAMVVATFIIVRLKSREYWNQIRAYDQAGDSETSE